MNYATLKWVHVSAVALSLGGFTARGLGALRQAAWIRDARIRMAVHLVDTVLLASAIGMLWIIHVTPLALPWLRAKIVGLALYIALGSMALGRDRFLCGRKAGRFRFVCWVAALVVFAYIVSVAVTKSPLGVLSR
jgi:uncharacterized membrane protein SirB2